MDIALEKKGNLLNLLSKINKVDSLVKLESLALDLIRWENSLVDDDIDVIAETKSDANDSTVHEEILFGYQPQSNDDLLFKYAGGIEPSFDLDQIAAEQGITSFDLVGFDILVEKADIQEDIDTLLSLID